MLYFAYGMNTNRVGMRTRCPEAISLGHARLPGYRLRFAGPADVVKDKNYVVHGVLWQLTDNCLKSLDLFEGYPNFYNRKTVEVIWQDETFTALTYYMTPGHKNNAPSDYYFDEVYLGYIEHKVPTQQLARAKSESQSRRRYLPVFDPIDDFDKSFGSRLYNYEYLSK